MLPGQISEDVSETPEQLPCRSAEAKFFSVFLCQRCREIWREILVKFSVLCVSGFGCATENFTKISRQKRCEKRKISRKFHSAGALNFRNFVSNFASCFGNFVQQKGDANYKGSEHSLMV